MDVPLSMFSIVGLIGMSGIIINDSIVLVTTIDEYAEKRGLVPAIIDACSDRFRPVLLTTLTTVLGLTPLLFESSAQAQFLKPTIITLSFGLGFGMFLVLLVVPSMVIMQRDVGRLFTSLRRGLTGARMPYRVQSILVLAVLGVAGMIATTLAPLALTLKPSALVVWATGGSMSALAASLMVFTLGILGVLIAAFGIFVLSGRKRA